MASSTRVNCIAPALAAISAFVASATRAQEFVSEQYGFRFKIPDGFHERTDDTPNTLKMFAEDETRVGGYLITIHIQRLGQIVNPSERVDPAQLPHKEGLTLTLETRRWQEVELQALRQDATVGPNTHFVGYLIQFPLKDEGIQLRVQGPKSRERKVEQVFDESVQSFANLKPHIVSMERVEPGKATRAATQYLLAIVPPCVLAVAMIYFMIRIRKSQAKSTQL